MAATTVREVQGKLAADECIAACNSARSDLNLLFSLLHWAWLDGSRFGSKFKAFIESNTSLCRQQLQSAEFRKGFEARVEHAVRKAGIQNLTPELVVEGYRKQEVMDKYFAVRDSWPPHKAFLLQMKPGLYLIFADFQTAFHCVREMVLTGRYRSRESGKYMGVELLYEMQMEGEPCRIILDCDAYLEDYEGLLDKDEVVESVLQVPQVLTRELVRVGAIPRHATVRAAVKDKSREGKVSFHFTLNVVGIPTGDLKAVFAKLVLEPYSALHTRCRSEKTRVWLARHIGKSKGEDGVYAHALAHIDPATVKGKHQFSLAFSRKKGEKPPRMDWVHWITDGGAKVKRVQSSFHGESVVPSHDRALDMLYFAGFVHWTPGTLVIDCKFRVPTDMGLASSTVSFLLCLLPAMRVELMCLVAPPGQAKKRGLDQPPAENQYASASSKTGAVHQDRKCSLPQWMKSAWMPGAGQKYGENSQMECLQLLYRSLSRLVPDVLLEDMVHVVGVPCPVSVLYSKTVVVHGSNGIYMARKPDGNCDVVYARCTHCVLDKSLLPKYDSSSDGGDEGALAEIVGDLISGHPWVAYTRQNYPKIIAAMGRGTQGNSGSSSSSIGISTPHCSSSPSSAHSSSTTTGARSMMMAIKIPKKQKRGLPDGE